MTIVEIKNLCRQLEDILKDEVKFNYERYLRVDMAFHTTILETSHNELLAQIGRTMRVAVQTARRTDIHDIHVILASQPFHAAIAQAIERQDPARAYQASLEMFEQVWKNFPENHNGITHP